MQRMLMALVLAWAGVVQAAGTVAPITTGFFVGTRYGDDTRTACKPTQMEACQYFMRDWYGPGTTIVTSGAWCVAYPPGQDSTTFAGYWIGPWVACTLAVPLCPANATLGGSSCTCNRGHEPDAAGTACVPAAVDCDGCSAGNPVQPGSGRKLHEETDYAGAGAAPLELRRLYRSSWGDGLPAAGLAPRPAWGGGWRFSLHARLALLPSGEVRAVRPDGRIVVFRPQGTAAAGTPATWAAQAGSADTLSELLDAAGQRSGFVLKVFADDSTEQYDASGRLLALSARHGWTTTVLYDAGGRLAGVRNAFGRQLEFGYDAAGRIATMVAPGGEVTRYDYDGAGNLASVTWPDGHLRRYHYEDARHPDALTGVTDELGVRIGQYAYDALGRVVESARAGGAERLSLAYPAPGQTTLTDHSGPAPVSRSYGFVNDAGVLRPTGLSAPCALCGATAQALAYDALGRRLRERAHDGSVSFFAYDTKGREVERAVFPAAYAEATTRPPLSAATSVTSTRWHASWNLPTQLAEPGRFSAFSYSAKGLLTGSSWTTMSRSTSCSAAYAKRSAESGSTATRCRQSFQSGNASPT